MSSKLQLYLLGGVTFFISGFFYLLTLCPAISWIDSGELSVVCHTLGIAHPTGYPLYTLIGKVFSLIPVGTVIFRFNLLSLLFISFSNLIIYFLFLNIYELLFPAIRDSALLFIIALRTFLFIYPCFMVTGNFQ
ncbi:MAG: DUF2723 domain-containing protein [candidate division Zixibacteria bacterium]|nr:DUF2723 domain-containing protein [candidate division Zixibacteria bacterium]